MQFAICALVGILVGIFIYKRLSKYEDSLTGENLLPQFGGCEDCKFYDKLDDWEGFCKKKKDKTIYCDYCRKFKFKEEGAV